MPLSTQKIAHTPAQLGKHAYATVQQPLHHANHCDSSCTLSSAQGTNIIHASPWRSRCHTGIIKSSALVQAHSSLPLSMVCNPLGCRGNLCPQNYISAIVAEVFSKVPTPTSHIELPAKLLDHFLRSNKSNINQYNQVFLISKDSGAYL